tara:strand:+ start:90 stop:317 length:228 start_codon:yes stop_codon:yes gene_type:complete
MIVPPPIDFKEAMQVALVVVVDALFVIRLVFGVLGAPSPSLVLAVLEAVALGALLELGTDQLTLMDFMQLLPDFA